MATIINIAVFGLGSMGYGMARSCLRHGHATWGYDVIEEAVTRFVGEGGKTGEISVAAGEWDCVALAVINAPQTESVLFGDGGVVRHLNPGTVVVSSATVSPEFAREMEGRCAEHGILYLDAPISGGSVKAAAGQLSFMASGSPAAFSKARPALDAMAETVFEMGDEAGFGSAMKAVNQLLAGVHIAAMGEALTFGVRLGIDAARIVEVITRSAGNSWMFGNRAPHVVSGDYTPHSAIDIWLKDLAIVLDIAKNSKFPAPLGAAALQQFIAASASGLGREDDAAVAKVYARNANVTLPGMK